MAVPWTENKLFMKTIHTYKPQFDWSLIESQIWLVWNTYMNDPPNQHPPSTHLIAKYVFTPTKSYFFEKKKKLKQMSQDL